MLLIVNRKKPSPTLVGIVCIDVRPLSEFIEVKVILDNGGPELSLLQFKLSFDNCAYRDCFDMIKP